MGPSVMKWKSGKVFVESIDLWNSLPQLYSAVHSRLIRVHYAFLPVILFFYAQGIANPVTVKAGTKWHYYFGAQ